VTIPGVIHRSIDRFTDDRGFFSEIFRVHLVDVQLVQANHSHSKAGVVRGLHYHRKQSDLWYVAAGEIRSVLVDLRDGEPDPNVEIVTMSADRPATLYIPPGVAHGFSAITDCDLIYWVSHEYDATDEFGIAWNDARLGIDWGVNAPILSNRDRENPSLDRDSIPSFS
jgi:dTDP-4-dehydrorhamnose 3,5-epimerase